MACPRNKTCYNFLHLATHTHKTKAPTCIDSFGVWTKDWINKNRTLRSRDFTWESRRFCHVAHSIKRIEIHLSHIRGILDLIHYSYTFVLHTPIYYQLCLSFMRKCEYKIKNIVIYVILSLKKWFTHLNFKHHTRINIVFGYMSFCITTEKNKKNCQFNGL